ncbi:MAG: response regulator, partial [Blastocatellia bacterium]
MADDSVTIQKVVNLTFADEGIDVMTVGDGDSAMSKLQEFRPDVVLADVNMPGLTGYQVCEFIRSNEATKNLPVILLVGSFEPFDELEAGRVGANAYLTKPFQSIRQLVSQVNELMETSQHVDISAAETVEFETPIVDHAETDDIESLYHQSFPDMSEMMGNAEHGTEFSDVGLDDEIIETSSAAGA